MLSWRWLGGRVLAAVPVMLFVITVGFFMMRLTPGGPFDRDFSLPAEIEANIRAKYKLDAPLWRQYIDYLGGVVRGDLGPSFKYSNRTVNEVIAESFPASLCLGLLSIGFALSIGLAVGILAALRRGAWQDYLTMGLVLLGVSVPNIVIGPLLVVVFGLWLGWLPVAGWGGWSEVVLPTITLGAVYLAYIARLVRTGVLETMHFEHVQVARAKGLSESAVLVRHVLPCALLPVISYLGPALAAVLTGSIVVETIFMIPGLGQHFVQAALNRDYTLAMGTVIFYAMLLLLFNILVDALYRWIDPRLRGERPA